MKRIVVAVALVVLLPVAAYADLGIGGVAMYNSPVLLGQEVDETELNVNKFTFGGDLRLKLSLFQGEAMVLYSASDVVQSLDIFLDAGVALDVLILRLSAGAGPNFTYNIGESDKPLQTGLNFKLNADVKFGKISAGLTYITDLNIDGGIDIDTSAGLLGATVLLWL